MNVSHDNFLSIGPVFDGKMLHIDMSRLLSGDKAFDHIGSGHVVFIAWSGTNLWVSEIQKGQHKGI